MAKESHGLVPSLGIALTLAALGTVLFEAPAVAATGRTAGSFTVTPTGAASYNIPIFTPPGPHGVQPNIALVYNSASGIGPVGKGWSIAGLSSISRCNKTYAQDGVAATVALTTSDRFCLDGSRLRLTSGSYGVAGSTYQTEVADFSLVTAVGSAGTGPASFTVKGKDGLTYEYGATTDARVLAGASTADLWMLDQISDRTGNRVKFAYKTPDSGTVGTTEPTSIEWTATSSGGSTFLYKMVFVYGNNTPPSSLAAYVAGTPVRNDDILTSIAVQVSGTTQRKYFLAYQTSPSTGVLRLQAVTECSDDAGTDCLQPTTVGYQNGQAGVSATPTAVVSGTTGSSFKRFDLNGDGFKDLVYQSSGYWYVKFGSASGFGGAVATGLQAISGSSILLGDVRANGQDGILYLPSPSGTWTYYFWNGSTFSGTATGVGIDSGDTATLADVDGDGRPDLITVVYASATVRYRLNTSSATSPSFGSLTTGANIAGASIDAYYSADSYGRPLDFNGDERADVAIHTVVSYVWYDPLYNQPIQGYLWSTYLIVSAPGGGFSTVLIDQIDSTGYGYSPPPRLPTFLSLNDDNCTDWAITTDTGSTLTISGCSGTNTGTTYPSGAVAILDWDGDGRSDVFAYSGSSLVVYLSNGNGFNSPISAGIAYQSGQWSAEDVNGDGLDDLVFTASGQISYYLHNAAGQAPDLATSFTDGYGVNQTVSYTPATWNNYTKQADSTYPNRDYAGSMQVVSNVNSTDGIGGTFNQSYWYYGAATNIQGRGFAGFASRKVTDSRTGVYQIDYYQRAFPYTATLIKSEAYQSAGTLISRREITPAANTLDATANNQRYFIYPSSIVGSQYEVGGGANGQLVTQTSESRTYDSWGNATAVSSTITDKDTGSPLYNASWTQSTSLTIYPDSGSNWCLGLPSSVSTAYSTTTGEASVTRSRSFTPDYANCRISAEITEPSGGNRRVDTSYGFDSFGNVNSISVTGRDSSGNAMSARTTTIGWGTTGQFPVLETNALSQTTNRTFHGTFGLLATETDPNGIVVANNTYDSFGRPSRATRSDGTSTVYTYTSCVPYTCENGDPASGATGINKSAMIASERDVSDSQIRVDWTYLDQFERPIVWKSQTLSGGYNRVGRQYDALGRIYRQTAPCDAVGCAAYWVTNTYDLLGRLTQQSRPQSQTVSTAVTTTFAYAGRTQTVTDPQSKVTTKVLDVKGLMRRSQDHNGYYQALGYDAFGSLKQVTDSLSNTLFTANYSYGIQPFQDSTSDMDLGARSYYYNSLGELTSWTDAKSQSFSQTFDALSRVLTRTEAEGTTTFTYGATAASHNIGRLASVAMSGYSESNSFDSVGRLTTQTVTADQSYAIDIAYTNQGKLDTLTYPTSTSGARVKVKYGYQYGVLQSVTDWTSGSAGTVYWIANSRNPRGQTTQETLGNGVVTTRAIDAVTGWLASIQSGVSGGAGLQNQSYLYDLVGNITQRQEGNLGLTENFYYDNLYRLSYSTLNGSTNLSLSYDAMGNIQTKSDVGGGATWSYHATRKHAVIAAGSGNSFGYDANGNMNSRNGATISWASYNLPTGLAAGSESATFSYNPNRQYYRQIYSGPSGTETTYYIGGLLEKMTSGSLTDWRHYIMADGQVVAIVSRKSSGANAVSYPLEDHLGSPSVLSSSSGSSLVRESFGAFGLPRNGATWSGAVPSGDQSTIAAISREGFTGHNMLGSMGLIHMNGRVQDAVTGRFLSPDPTVPNPGFTQSFNRYAYVNDNPLSFVDPSGFADADLPGVTVRGTYTGGGAPAGIPAVGGGGNENDLSHPSYDANDWNNAVQGDCMSNPNCGKQQQASKDTELEEVKIVATRTHTPQLKTWEGPHQQGLVSSFFGIDDLLGQLQFALLDAVGCTNDYCQLAAMMLGAKVPGMRFSSEKQALVDMAQADRRLGITSADMQAYKDLNRELPDPFPTNQVRGPESHASGGAHSQQSHGHVGPVQHIPIVDP